jgi:hypothetical protein
MILTMFLNQMYVESRYFEVHGTVAKFPSYPKFDLSEVRD